MAEHTCNGIDPTTVEKCDGCREEGWATSLDFAQQILWRLSFLTLGFAVMRHSLELEDGEEITDEKEREIHRDVYHILAGEDTGCLEESDLTEENSAIVWLRARLSAFCRGVVGLNIKQYLLVEPQNEVAPLKPAADLQDFERAMVFLFMLEHAGPEITKRADEVDVFCRLNGWPRERAEAAFAEGARQGFINTTVPNARNN